jgi:hypothetical protein
MIPETCSVDKGRRRQPMERWAARTLRILGIILTAGVTLIACLVLFLLSMCASNGSFSRHPDKALPFIIGGLVVMVGGLWLTVRLARGLRKQAADASATSAGTADATMAPVPPSQPLVLSSAGRMAVDRVVFALGAQIAVSLICWFLNRRFFWSASNVQASPLRTLILLLPFVLYHIPYALLMVSFIRKVTRLTFVYCVAVSGMMTLQTLLYLAIGRYSHVNHPEVYLLVFLPWVIDIVILGMAWQTARQLDIRLDASSVVVAALVTLAWLLFVNFSTPWIFRLVWR